MRFLSVLILFISINGFAQTTDLKLQNAIVVAQLDKAEDRFTMEINLTEMLASNGVKAIASLNILKEGSSVALLANDSIQAVLKEKGFDTYVLVSVRGYDRKFKPAKNHLNLKEELVSGHMFPFYRDEVSSISFEFLFYRNGEVVGYDLIKVAGINKREAAIKKFRKKTAKRIVSNWK
ncbi:MAG: hypothetical protein PHQ74_05275 [Crocinitomicaceae bacterium]|nr:hypothetical protein [Crocinitomicaceae bacterium]